MTDKQPGVGTRGTLHANRTTAKSQLPVYMQASDGKEASSDGDVRVKVPAWETNRSGHISIREALDRTQAGGHVGKYGRPWTQSERVLNEPPQRHTRSAPPGAAGRPAARSTILGDGGGRIRIAEQRRLESQRRSADPFVGSSTATKPRQFYAAPKSERENRPNNLFGRPNVSAPPARTATAQSQDRRQSITRPNTASARETSGVSSRRHQYTRSNSTPDVGHADAYSTTRSNSVPYATLPDPRVDAMEDDTYDFGKWNARNGVFPIPEDPSLSQDVAGFAQLTPATRAEQTRRLYNHLVGATLHHYSGSSESNTSSMVPAPQSPLSEAHSARSRASRDRSPDQAERYSSEENRLRTESESTDAPKVEVEPATDQEHNSSNSSSDADPSERIAAEASLFELQDHKSERGSIRVPSESSDEERAKPTPINTADPPRAADDLRRIAAEVSAENPLLDVSSLDGLDSTDEADLMMGPGPDVKTAAVLSRPKIKEEPDREEVDQEPQDLLKADTPSVYEKVKHELKRSLSDIMASKDHKPIDVAALPPPGAASATVHIVIAVPRLWVDDATGRTLTWLGTVVLALAAWYASERLMCHHFCHPQYGTVDTVWHPSDPFFPYALPTKLDQWAGHAFSRAAASAARGAAVAWQHARQIAAEL